MRLPVRVSKTIPASLAVALVFVFVSCRAQLDTTTKSGGPQASGVTPPQDTPVVQPPAEPQSPSSQPIDKEGSARTVREINYAGNSFVAQSGSLLRIKAGKELTAGADKLYLVDQSSGRRLGLNPDNIDSCGSAYCYHLSALEMDPAIPGKRFLNYGQNYLLLVAATADEDRTSKVSITMRDFPVYGLLNASIAVDSVSTVDPAEGGTLQPISLNTVDSLPASTTEENPAAPVLIPNWQETVIRP